MTLARLGGRRDATPQPRLRLLKKSGAGGMPASGFESTSTPDAFEGFNRGGQKLGHAVVPRGFAFREEPCWAQIEAVTVPPGASFPRLASRRKSFPSPRVRSVALPLPLFPPQKNPLAVQWRCRSFLSELTQKAFKPLCAKNRIHWRGSDETHSSCETCPSARNKIHWRGARPAAELSIGAANRLFHLRFDRRITERSRNAPRQWATSAWALHCLRVVFDTVEFEAKWRGELDDRPQTHVVNVNFDPATAVRMAQIYLSRHGSGECEPK